MISEPRNPIMWNLLMLEFEMDNGNVLQVKMLKKTYQVKKSWKHNAYKINALNSISLKLKPGLYGLLGPNGAGKSTLINILTGNISQSSGKVLWNGKSIVHLGKSYRRILGYMPQQQNLYDMFTGERFLSYLCALKEIPPNDTNCEIARVAAAVNLTDQLSKRLSAYSGGMKQRLLAAGAIIGNPQLIILDEPTAGLDPKERVRLRQMIKQYSEQAIIILATHVVSDIETTADSVILLNKGNIDKIGSPADLVREYAPGGSLEDVYLHVFGED